MCEQASTQAHFKHKSLGQDTQSRKSKRHELEKLGRFNVNLRDRWLLELKRRGFPDKGNSSSKIKQLEPKCQLGGWGEGPEWTIYVKEEWTLRLERL